MIRAIILAALLTLPASANAEKQKAERLWKVVCGLPIQDDSLRDFIPPQKDFGLSPEEMSKGHLDMKAISRNHPKSGISFELWVLSRNVGWWVIMKLRPKSSDWSYSKKMKNRPSPKTRFILESPFLLQPVTMYHSDFDKIGNIVVKQIDALLPHSSQLRCVHKDADIQGVGSPAGGSSVVARTDKERYYALLAKRIRGFWMVPPGIADFSRLKTDITIDVGRDGNYRNLRVMRYSGNHIYDQAALRAVQRAAEPSLPKPPDTIKEKWLYLGFRFCGTDFCR